jgi:hypothetical protein
MAVNALLRIFGVCAGNHVGTVGFFRFNNLLITTDNTPNSQTNMWQWPYL